MSQEIRSWLSSESVLMEYIIFDAADTLCQDRCSQAQNRTTELKVIAAQRLSGRWRQR